MLGTDCKYCITCWSGLVVLGNGCKDCLASWSGLVVLGIGCNRGASWRASGTGDVLGILNIREELSGLSMDSDLNEDEDDECRF